VPDGTGDAYLAKPFEPAELVETVRCLVRRCRAADQPPEQPRGRTAAHPGA
jgi:DNA-binding response OmpR family regulator